MASMSQYTIVGQASFPHWVRGRASAVQLMTAQGAFALGAFVWGQCTAHGSLHLALGISAAGMAVAVVAGLRRPLQASQPPDLSPHHHQPQHAGLMREPSPGEGPVLVAVAWQIHPEDETAFSAAMQSLRGVRMRDGAFRWGLYQDLQRPGIIHEIFLVEDWGTHLRQHARYTRENRRLEEQALQYHRGPEPPVATHCVKIHPRG